MRTAVWCYYSLVSTPAQSTYQLQVPPTSHQPYNINANPSQKKKSHFKSLLLKIKKKRGEKNKQNNKCNTPIIKYQKMYHTCTHTRYKWLTNKKGTENLPPAWAKKKRNYSSTYLFAPPQPPTGGRGWTEFFFLFCFLAHPCFKFAKVGGGWKGGIPKANRNVHDDTTRKNK